MQASLHCRRAAAAASSSSASASASSACPAPAVRRPLSAAFFQALGHNNNQQQHNQNQQQQQQQQHNQQQQQQRRRPLAALRPRRPLVAAPPSAAAAAAGGAGGASGSGSGSGSGGAGETDPFKVLGLPRDADNNAINRAFRVKKFEARGDDAETARLEAAHSALMMASLASRVRGAGAAAVPAEVRYADREPLFPWRPKRWDATPKVILAVGAIQLAVAVFGLQAPQFSKIVGSGLVGVAGNVLKANAISPPPRNPETATEEESGRSGRNFVRGLLLGLMATVGGILLFSLPDAAVTAFGLALPPWVPTGPAAVLSVRIAGVALCNFLITAFFH